MTPAARPDPTEPAEPLGPIELSDASGSAPAASPPPAGGEGPAGGEAIGYAAALAELDDILHELDADEVDVDVLGARVRRAAELLRICRSRIASARFEVEQVVAELESDAGTPDGP